VFGWFRREVLYFVANVVQTYSPSTQLCYSVEDKNTIESHNISESPVGQRLKFLIKELGLTVRSFSQRLDIGETTTRNYFNRGSKPSAEYLEKLSNTFEQLNLAWLLTGKGEPFLSSVTIVAEQNANYQSPTQNQKKNRGHIINHTGNGPAVYSLEDCKRERDQWIAKCESHEREIELLKGQVADKDEIIRLLKNNQPK
jgi:transcriptional regulator with XRE-family HTH domain